MTVTDDRVQFSKNTNRGARTNFHFSFSYSRVDTRKFRHFINERVPRLLKLFWLRRTNPIFNPIHKNYIQ